MKKHILFPFLIAFICVLFHSFSMGQSFHKGSLLVSISEGSTKARYSTRDITRSDIPTIYTSNIDGVRDPIIIEYGLTNKWGIGLTSGGDVFKVSPNRYYGFKLPNYELLKVTTSEFTFDVNYHYFVNQKWDISANSSVGLFGVSYDGELGDSKLKYESSGAMIRIGTKARYYFYKHLGVMGMFSLYSATSSPKAIKTNTVAQTVSTSINGRALEFGLCYRFFKP